MKTQDKDLQQGQELRGNEQQESLQQQTSTKGGEQQLGREGLQQEEDLSKDRGSESGSERNLQSDLDEE